MAVEDHPSFPEWSAALDKLKEAKDRFEKARNDNDPGLDGFRRDLHKAQREFTKIADEIE